MASEKDNICVEFYLVDAFEIYHFLPLYFYFTKNEIDVKFVAEPPEKNTSGKWFDYEMAIHILESNRVRYSVKANYDSDYVFTTQEAYLLKGYKYEKVHLSYGYGLLIKSFMLSERSIDGFDKKFIHGVDSLKRLEGRIPMNRIHIIGYPKYMWGYDAIYEHTGWLREKINAMNFSNKPILAYIPTWDKISTISSFSSEIKKLKKDFFIISKEHHCTSRLKSESEHRRLLREMSDIVCAGNFSFGEFASEADIAICDAISGSATEAPLVNENIKLVLLDSPANEYNEFVPEISGFAHRVHDPKDLVDAVRAIWDKDNYLLSRNKLLKNMFMDTTEDCLDEFVKKMYKH